MRPPTRARAALALALGSALAGAARPARAEGEDFPPPRERPQVGARRAEGAIRLDGRLDEADWARAKAAGGFRQIEPHQGRPASFDTEVRVLYDDKYLYFGAVCRDPAGAAGARATDLKRDFEPDAHDIFGVSLDLLVDGRNAMVFQVNPYGALRDEQAFDDTLFDREWDAVWRAETARGPSGWTAEIAIPWASLRYPEGARRFGLQMVRTLRRRNEVTGWSPWPRSFSPTRMSYEGYLEGVRPPPAGGSTVQLRPYAKGTLGRTSLEGARLSPDAGGEVKWSPTPDSALDLTFNTDFAETDVDRQVVNLQRYSVYLPERRQFFLESASLFSVGYGDFLQPFFSRSIGLVEGQTVPIDAGARFVRRSADESYGGLVVRTRGRGAAPPSLFAVGRYSHNVGEQGRLGASVVVRRDEARGDAPATDNLVASVDGFTRVGEVTAQAMLSYAHTERRRPGAPDPHGAAATLRLFRQDNSSFVGFDTLYVDRRYEARAGFVARTDMLNTNPYATFDLRPSWRPSFVRSIRPHALVDMYHSARDLRFQEALVHVEPLHLLFESGDRAYAFAAHSLQSLDEPFEPIRGVRYEPGSYAYARRGLGFRSNPSRRLSASAEAGYGGFYESELAHGRVELGVRPLPHVSFFGRYEVNAFDDLPGREGRLVTHLVSPELRLALNPRLQLVGSYQRDTANDATIYYGRFAWEFQPLSFLYVVYTDRSRVSPPEGFPANERQLIVKLNYTWQL
ncbi:MAG TPA: DUF5916 domain-containing protein [Polyangiaceae bacterium]|nr:DUF5916 domain-containing protein [Polyangiaceae bacterium]